MTIVLKLPQKLDARLASLAKKTHRSKNYYIRRIIEYYIEDLENYYLAMNVM